MFALLALVFWLGLHRLDREISFYDEGLYIVNAQSLSKGAGYRNLSLPDAPPQGIYPPFLPLLLSLVGHLLPSFPDNLPAMKALILFMGLGLLVLTYGYLRTCLRFTGLDSMAVATMIGLNPLFLLFTTFVISDIPYAFLSILAIYLYERSLVDDRTATFGGAVIVASLAFLTRTLGLLLLVAMIVHLLLRHRTRRALIGILAGASVVFPWLGWSRWASAEYSVYPFDVRRNYIGHVVQLASTDWMLEFPSIVLLNLRSLLYAWSLVVLPWAPEIIASLSILLAYLFLRQLGTRLRLQEIYCGLYLLVILIAPLHGTVRYFFPVSPFLIAYFIGGGRVLFSKVLGKSWSDERTRSASNILVAALLLGALTTDLSAHWRISREHDREMYVEFHRMLGWIDRNLPSDAILIGDYDPAYYLFTGRKAIRLPTNDLRMYYAAELDRDYPHARELLASYRRMKACYLIRDPMIGGREHIHFGNVIEALRQVSPAPFAPLYVSRDESFAVYKLSGCPEGSA